MSGLTKRQRDAMVAIQTHQDRWGDTPSISVLSAMIGQRSKCGTQRLVLGLEDRGYIRRRRSFTHGMDILRRIETRTLALYAVAGPNGDMRLEARP